MRYGPFVIPENKVFLECVEQIVGPDMVFLVKKALRIIPHKRKAAVWSAQFCCTPSLHDITIFYDGISHAVDKSYSPDTITTRYVDTVSAEKRRLFNVANAWVNCYDRDVIHSTNAWLLILKLR